MLPVLPVAAAGVQDQHQDDGSGDGCNDLGRLFVGPRFINGVQEAEDQ